MGTIAIVDTPNEATIDRIGSRLKPARLRMIQRASPRSPASTRVSPAAFKITGNASRFKTDLADRENVFVAWFIFASRVFAFVPPTKYSASWNSLFGKSG